MSSAASRMPPQEATRVRSVANLGKMVSRVRRELFDVGDDESEERYPRVISRRTSSPSGSRLIYRPPERVAFATLPVAATAYQRGRRPSRGHLGQPSLEREHRTLHRDDLSTHRSIDWRRQWTTIATQEN